MAKGSGLARAVEVLQEGLVFVGVRPSGYRFTGAPWCCKTLSGFQKENGVALHSNRLKQGKTIFKSGTKYSLKKLARNQRLERRLKILI